MQSVIGVYPSFLEAQRAVRTLERHQVSIQDVVIADQTRRIGRPSQLSSEQQDRMKGRSDFLVIMTGEASNIARATELLLERPER